MSYEEHLIRVAEAAQLQERIEIALAYNARVGDTVNSARLSLARLPIVAVVAGTVGYLATIWV